MTLSTIQKKKGFTLIELLVVISIIGLLSSVILAGMTTARDKAQDARRKTDMRTFRNALALYYSNNNSYPLSLDLNPSGTAGAKNASGLGVPLAGILPNPPTDPKWSSQPYQYISNVNVYAMRMRLADGTYCRVVEPHNPSNGWWSTTPFCEF